MGFAGSPINSRLFPRDISTVLLLRYLRSIRTNNTWLSALPHLILIPLEAWCACQKRTAYSYISIRGTEYT
jgi:hypothetical protein